MNLKSTIDFASQLAILDWLIIIFSLIITLFTAFLAKSSHKATNFSVEYLLMGRTLSLPLFVATLVSTWYGGILGVTQITYEQGIYNFITQGLSWYIAYILFIVFMVKRIRRNQPLSLTDLIRQNIGNNSAVVTAIFLVFKALPVTYAISLGILINQFLNINLSLGICLGVTFVALYSHFGGLRAIVYSDAIQFIFMFSGLISLILVSYFNYGGLNYLQNNLPISHFAPNGTNSISDTLLWFFIACSITFVSPAFYQRCLAAKSEFTAITGIIIAIIIWLCFDVCTTLTGLYARAALANTPARDAFLTYSLQILPTGLKGLLIASILATILSTLDSFLIIAKSIVMFDIPYINKLSNWSRSLVSLLMTIILLIVISCSFNGNIEMVWKFFKSYFSACILLPVVFAIFKPKFIEDLYFVITCITSCICMAIWDILKLGNILGSYYIGALMSIICLASFYVINKIDFLFKVSSKSQKHNLFQVK
jgi:SSS family solute:Na+ symporter